MPGVVDGQACMCDAHAYMCSDINGGIIARVSPHYFLYIVGFRLWFYAFEFLLGAPLTGGNR